MNQVILVVFDGLNDELVTPELMPNLTAFSQRGVQLANHRPVFPSVTRLNAASMVTGCFPGAHGLHGNLSLVPEFHPTEPMDALEPQLTELRERGRVLLVPTLADILEGYGLRYIAAGVGTSGQAFMHCPNADESSLGATIHPEYTLPRSLYNEIVARFGEWPEKTLPNTPRMERVTDIFTDYVLSEQDPEVALLWFSEPDSSQHSAGLNSPTARQAASDADNRFGALLDWLDATGRLDTTNVIATCDHGQATIIDPVPLTALLAEQGFAGPGEPGGVIVAGNGSSALFYIDEHNAEVADRLAAWLTDQPWAGPLLATSAVGPIEGALPASLLGLEGPRSPDLFLSFGWDEEANEHGRPGRVFASGGAGGRGTHGSMSPWEFRTFTVASGPAFKQETVIDSATGHPDIAPTILKVLGLEIPAHIQGRPITEALAEGAPEATPTVQEHYAERNGGSRHYQQTLAIAAAGAAGGHLVRASMSTTTVAELGEVAG